LAILLFPNLILGICEKKEYHKLTSEVIGGVGWQKKPLKEILSH